MPNNELWIPPRAREEFRKADPPKTGTQWNAWGDQHSQYIKLPGGGVLQFDLSKLTLDDFRSMRDHYQINASLKILTFMIHQLDWSIECEDQKIADEVERQLRARWTRLVRGMAVAFWAGYGPCVIEWENNLEQRKIEISKIKDVRPENARVHWKEIEGYAPPGFIPPKIKLYDGLDIHGSSFPVPPENTIHYPLLMEAGDYYGTKLLKPAFPAWFFSQLIHLFANRYFERFGEPVPIGRAPFDDDVSMNGKMVSGQSAMETVLRNLRNRSVVTMPSDRDENGNYDYDLEYLESQMRGADFERYLSRLDEEMSLGLFTPILLFRTADVGSYNLGVSHMQVFLWMLNALAGDMKEYIDEYICERIKAINFSPRAPRCEWVPRKMGKENVETLRAIVSQLLADGRAGADLDELSQAIGLTITERRVLDDEEGAPGGDGGDDDRIGRPERRTDGPNGPGRERETGRQVNARVAAQIKKHFAANDTLDGFVPNWGYQRKAAEQFGEDGSAEFFSFLESSFGPSVEGLGLDEALATADALIEIAMNKAMA